MLHSATTPRAGDQEREDTSVTQSGDTVNFHPRCPAHPPSVKRGNSGLLPETPTHASVPKRRAMTTRCT